MTDHPATIASKGNAVKTLMETMLFKAADELLDAEFAVQQKRRERDRLICQAAGKMTGQAIGDIVGLTSARGRATRPSTREKQHGHRVNVAESTQGQYIATGGSWLPEAYLQYAVETIRQSELRDQGHRPK
jgi:hypothetical protein